MNYIDIIIIILFALGAFYGVKKGFINGILSLIGLIVILTISFIFKGELASLFFNHLPFFKFHGSFEGLTSLNILLYEGIAFLLIFSFLIGILGLVLKITGVLQKLIDYSIVLTLPSKILGILVGLLNALIIVYVMLFVLINTNSTRKAVYNSKLSTIILERTFVLSSVTSDEYLAYEQINNNIKVCKKDNSKNKCNKDTVNILIKYDIVDKKEVERLIDNKKLKGITRKDLIENYD